jgi:hypothetical protein
MRHTLRRSILSRLRTIPAGPIYRPHGVALTGSDMPGPPKITLAQAKAQGDFVLMFYCVRPALCWHSGEMRLDEAD